MSKKIYIDYASETYYTSKKDLRDVFEEEGEYTPFDSFLDYNYNIEDVFNFDEEDRKRVQEEYKNVLDEEFDDWITSNLTVIDIDIEFKESK